MARLNPETQYLYYVFGEFSDRELRASYLGYLCSRDPEGRKSFKIVSAIVAQRNRNRGFDLVQRQADGSGWEG